MKYRGGIVLTKTIEISSRIIGMDKLVFIIAEPGVNQYGDIQLAKKLVDAAISAGVDAVKFQSCFVLH